MSRRASRFLAGCCACVHEIYTKELPQCPRTAVSTQLCRKSVRKSQPRYSAIHAANQRDGHTSGQKRCSPSQAVSAVSRLHWRAVTPQVSVALSRTITARRTVHTFFASAAQGHAYHYCLHLGEQSHPALLPSSRAVPPARAASRRLVSCVSVWYTIRSSCPIYHGCTRRR